MAKFIVTVVVETDKAEKPPTKKLVRAYMNNLLGMAGEAINETDRQELVDLFVSAVPRVRSIDID